MSQPIIVVVDDQSSVCDMIKMMLKDKYETIAFTSGAQAVKYLTSGHKADLVLLDYDMPDMTGYETLMHIRSEKRHNPDVPIIFVTAITNDRMESEMTARGANDYIRKPIQMRELHDCIEKHLRK